MHYTFDALGRFAGTSEAATERSTETAPAALDADYNWTGSAWVHVPVLALHAPPVAVFAASVLPGPPTFATLQAEAVRSIDVDVDAIYAAVIGNRQAEYERAEQQAQAYADGGFAGAAPSMVASWATAKGWTGRKAAEDILLQAATWRPAQELIRAQRLLRKEQARSAETPAALESVMVQWAGFMAGVREQLGL